MHCYEAKKSVLWPFNDKKMTPMQHHAAFTSDLGSIICSTNMTKQSLDKVLVHKTELICIGNGKVSPTVHIPLNIAHTLRALLATLSHFLIKPNQTSHYFLQAHCLIGWIHPKACLFAATMMHHLAGSLSIHGITALVIPTSNGLISHETPPTTLSEIFGGMLFAMVIMMEWRGSPHLLRDVDDQLLNNAQIHVTSWPVLAKVFFDS